MARRRDFVWNYRSRSRGRSVAVVAEAARRSVVVAVEAEAREAGARFLSSWRSVYAT